MEDGDSGVVVVVVPIMVVGWLWQWCWQWCWRGDCGGVLAGWWQLAVVGW